MFVVHRSVCEVASEFDVLARFVRTLYYRQYTKIIQNLRRLPDNDEQRWSSTTTNYGTCPYIYKDILIHFSSSQADQNVSQPPAFSPTSRFQRFFSEKFDNVVYKNEELGEFLYNCIRFELGAVPHDELKQAIKKFI